MSKEANTTLIGAFVLGAIVLLVTGIVVFSSGAFFAKVQRFVLYFPGSVKGLSSGARVDFRGAQIGRVVDMGVEYYQKEHRVKIPVVMEIDQGKIREVDTSTAAKTPQQEYEDVEALMQRGLRAFLSTESLLTGQLYVQLDFRPDTPIALSGLAHKYPEFPTAAPELEFTRQLQNIDLDKLAGSFGKALESVDALVRTPELKEAVGNFNELLKAGTRLVNRLDAKVDPLVEEAGDFSNDARAALRDARKAFANIERIFAEQAPLKYKLFTALDEIAAAAKAMKELGTYLERHPEALLRGKRRAGEAQ